jgi:peptidylprolyl isomerase
MAEPVKVKLATSKGNIVILLEEDKPITTGNFKKLVEQGFYDGIIFHRVIDGFMVQAGCPKGNGTRGPGYTIKDEFGKKNRNDRGTLSMANCGPDSGGSQFFINIVDNNYLDPKHPVFGKVVEGMDIVDTISKVKRDRSDKPKEDVIILKASVI